MAVLRCKINGCKIPVKAIRRFKEGEMEEPQIGDDNICINEYGFHDHDTKIFWEFKDARVTNERFQKSLA